MIHKATREIAAILKSANLKYDTVDDSRSSRIICGINGKDITYKVQFISLDDDNDVAIRAFDLVKIPRNKLDKMILLANQYNKKYRFVKFVVNTDDNTLQLDVDLPVKNEHPAEIAFEVLLRIMKILDEVSADFMRCIWA